MDNTKKEVDIYRDSFVRYFGYANEVGESFRGLVPSYIVYLSYVLSTGYVIADTVDKGYKVYQSDTSLNKIKRTTITTADTLIWQTLASIVIPGYTINRICAYVSYMQNNFFIGLTNSIPKRPWVPTIVGLIAIPFIVHPIDYMVEQGMNVTCRRWIGYTPLHNVNNEESEKFNK